MGWVDMSERELQRAGFLASVAVGQLTVTAAADLMGVSWRHAHRLPDIYEAHGAAGLRHRSRGRPSNRLSGAYTVRMRQRSAVAECT